MKNNHAGCYKTLQMIGVLHSRGYQRLRIFPYGHGMWWRCEVAPGELFEPKNGACLQSHPAHDREGLIARFGSGDCDHPFGWKKSIVKFSISKMADLFVQRFPAIAQATLGSDWEYAGWYQEMLMRTSSSVLPIAYLKDEYEEVVCEQLQLFRIDQTNDEKGDRDMPLPPLHKRAALVFHDEPVVIQAGQSRAD